MTLESRMEQNKFAALIKRFELATVNCTRQWGGSGTMTDQMKDQQEIEYNNLERAINIVIGDRNLAQTELKQLRKDLSIWSAIKRTTLDLLKV